MFVAVMVAKVQQLSSPSVWQFIPTLLNPADIISRKITVDQLFVTSKWMRGPTILIKSNSVGGRQKLKERQQVSFVLQLSTFKKSICIIDCLIHHKYSTNHRLLVQSKLIKCNLLIIKKLPLCGINKSLNSKNQQEVLLQSSKSVALTSNIIKVASFIAEHKLLRVSNKLQNVERSALEHHHSLRLSSEDIHRP